MTYSQTRSAILNELNTLLVFITLSQKHPFEQSEDVSTICNLMKKLSTLHPDAKDDMSNASLVSEIKRKYSVT